MAAGAGAEEQARVLAQRLDRERAALAEQQRRTEEVEAQLRSWRAGAEGERLVADELDLLRGHGWTLLHDVHWPGRPRANLDHVAVGPGGVVVIDAKNWSGTAEVRAGVLRNSTYRRTRECEAIAQMVAAVAAVLAPAHRSTVRGALCLVQHDQAPVAVEAGIVVVGRSALAAWLTGLPASLGPEDVGTVCQQLDRQLAAPTSATQLTTRHVPAAGGAPERALRQRRSGPPSPRTPAHPAVRSAATRRPRRRASSGALPGFLKVLVVLVLAVTARSWLEPVATGFEHVVEGAVAGSLTSDAPTPSPAQTAPVGAPAGG